MLSDRGELCQCSQLFEYDRYKDLDWALPAGKGYWPHEQFQRLAVVKKWKLRQFLSWSELADIAANTPPSLELAERIIRYASRLQFDTPKTECIKRLMQSKWYPCKPKPNEFAEGLRWHAGDAISFHAPNDLVLDDSTFSVTFIAFDFGKDVFTNTTRRWFCTSNINQLCEQLAYLCSVAPEMRTKYGTRELETLYQELARLSSSPEVYRRLLPGNEVPWLLHKLGDQMYAPIQVYTTRTDLNLEPHFVHISKLLQTLSVKTLLSKSAIQFPTQPEVLLGTLTSISERTGPNALSDTEFELLLRVLKLLEKEHCLKLKSIAVIPTDTKHLKKPEEVGYRIEETHDGLLLAKYLEKENFALLHPRVSQEVRTKFEIVPVESLLPFLDAIQYDNQGEPLHRRISGLLKGYQPGMRYRRLLFIF
jgi:hypothetical protein